jgi:hypothetical protein
MTDDQITMAIRRFLAAEKPKRTTPLDLLQIIRLLLQKSDEKDVYVPQDTLAEELCSSPDAIARSQKRLRSRGWLSVEKGGYRGRTNKYCVMLDRLPLEDLSRTVVSSPALKMAQSYYKALIMYRIRRKLPKRWVQQAAFTIQKLIDRTGGDAHRVAAVINYALSSPRYRGKANKGPHELKRVWRDLLADFDASQKLVSSAVRDTPETQHKNETNEVPA